MHQHWKLRLFFAFLGLGVALYLLVPTVIYFSLDEAQLKQVRRDKNAFAKYLPSWVPHGHIVPGLDLQGGIHIVLGVDLEKAITDKTSRSADRLVSFAKNEGAPVKMLEQVRKDNKPTDQVRLTFENESEVSAFKQKILPKYADFTLVSADKSSVLLELDHNLAQTIRNDAVDQTITTIRNRIDKMGVTEPVIAKSGPDKIQIQLPGYEDPEQAKSLLGRTAQLEFQMLDDETDLLKKLTDLPEGVELVDSGYGKPDGTGGKDIFLKFSEDQLDQVKNYLADKVDADHVIKYGQLGREGLGKPMYRTYTLMRKVELTGDDLVDARVSPGSDTNPRPGVGLSFSPTGARIFDQITQASIGKRMAIVLEDVVDSAPVIQTRISDGNAFISMGGARNHQEMMADANQLALVLKSGALPAPVSFREERSVGPSLGADFIKEAKVAFLIGSIVIALFMMFYYRGAGLIAIIGVLFNMAFILAVLSWLGATVTLPSVAALLLTIGMAVDTNVIIDERIREELRLGKMPRSAVKAGYDAAFSAVFDANFTTFIAGVVLWQFGTGPVQNFATMLLIGTVSSVITGVFVTRIFFDMITSRGPKTLSI